MFASRSTLAQKRAAARMRKARTRMVVFRLLAELAVVTVRAYVRHRARPIFGPRGDSRCPPKHWPATPMERPRPPVHPSRGRNLNQRNF